MADKAPGGSQKGGGKVRPCPRAPRGSAVLGGARPRPLGLVAGPGGGAAAGRDWTRGARPAPRLPALRGGGGGKGPGLGLGCPGAVCREGPAAAAGWEQRAPAEG